MLSCTPQNHPESCPAWDLLTQKLFALHVPAGPPGDSSAHWFGNSSSHTKCSVGSREGALVPHSFLCGTVRNSDPERLMKADVGMRLS